MERFLAALRTGQLQELMELMELMAPDLVLNRRWWRAYGRRSGSRSARTSCRTDRDQGRAGRGEPRGGKRAGHPDLRDEKPAEVDSRPE